MNIDFINSKNHISKDYFYSILTKRIWEYEEALFGTQKRPGVKQSMLSAMEYNIQKIKTYDYLNNLFGTGIWGYGVNSICDGKIEQHQTDVFQIQKIGGFNKWHEPYRKLSLLIFKIEDNFLYLNTFSIDTLQARIDSNINMKYDLKCFENAMIKTHSNYTYIEFYFTNLKKPISFQIDTYHFPGNYLSNDELAKYYKESIESIANNCKENQKKNNELLEIDFVEDFIRGIQCLQQLDIHEECIKKLKEGKSKDESSFRYWFYKWFAAQKGYKSIAEPEKGNGKIDLKILHTLLGEKIIEFKGWWNKDKENVVMQLMRYLTEFEEEGYIFMINNTKKSIHNKYKKLITKSEMHFVEGSLQEMQFKNTSYTYFISKHEFGGVKTIYHFIMSVY